MQDFLNGTTLLFTSGTGIAIFIGGLLGGLVFGAIPGLNVLTLAAVLLPFTAWMPAEYAIMLYGVIYVSGVYGGAITAILFNIPGSVENAPTAFDGYPMTRNGEASKAIGYAVTCSAIGGTLSAILMMIATEPIADFAVSTFGPIEIAALIFFGLTVVAGVGSKSLAKGWLSLCPWLAHRHCWLRPGSRCAALYVRRSVSVRRHRFYSDDPGIIRRVRSSPARPTHVARHL